MSDTTPSGPSGQTGETALSAEDVKLLTLARAARARTRAAVGAACRDLDGRTYAAGAVELTTLRLSAVQVCVAMAHSSGARGLEAVLVFSGLDEPEPLAALDAAVIADFGGDGVVIHRR